jgi:TPR repeat protein
LERLAQKLHNKVGIQKDFALWAVESWAMALNIVSYPLPQKNDEKPSNSLLTSSTNPLNISFSQKTIGKFIVQNEIAIDLQMKLMWLRFAYGQRWLDGELIGSSQKVNWENAMKIPEFFNKQNYLGYNDWRLPNIYELKTLIDMESGRKTGYFTDANVFPKKDTGWFWSSSDDTVEIYNAWYINFDDGYSSSNLKGFNLDVRLVRNANNIYLLPKTLYELGEKYYFDEDYKEAFKWYKLSAEQGYIAAQCSLAWMYENGLGVVQSDIEAFTCYRLAAEQGEAYAQTNLGWMYRDGRGVPQSDTEATNWFRLAAEQGDANSQGILSEMYEKGLGVKQSDTEAVKWCRLAAEQGDATAQLNLGHMYEKGLGITQSDEEAVKWYRLAADQGVAEAQHHLGLMYANGWGVSQSNEEAIRLFFLASEQGDANAQAILGEMFEDGLGVAQNDRNAVKWYRLAAEKGHAAAQNNLGCMYEKGKGIEQDIAEAVKYYQLAAEQGLDEANVNLALIYALSK